MDLAGCAEPPENKVGCTVFQATLCHCLAVRQGGMSLVTSVLSLSLSGVSSHTVYHLHSSFHGTWKTEVNSEEQQLNPQVCREILRCRYGHMTLSHQI